MGELVSEFLQALPANARGAFCFSVPMALESYRYRDPAEVAERNQAREQKERQRVGETIGKRWSSAREAAERLFEIPPPADQDR